MRTVALVAALVAVACSSKPKQEDPPPLVPGEKTAKQPPPNPVDVGVDVPVVIDRGVSPLFEGAPVVIAVTPTGIVVDGRAIVAVQNGDVDPAEKEGGTLGLRIPKLGTYVTTLVGLKPASGSAAVLAFERTVPARLLNEVAYTVHAAAPRLAVAVKTDGRIGCFPITLPQRAVGSKVSIVEADDLKKPPSGPVRPVVSVARDKLILWSFSGLEGTLAAPKLTVARDKAGLDQLATALSEIVKRRSSSGARSDDDLDIVVMPDSTLPMQDVADVMAVVRADAAGAPLFPSIVLSFGFE